MVCRKVLEMTSTLPESLQDNFENEMILAHYLVQIGAAHIVFIFASVF